MSPKEQIGPDVFVAPASSIQERYWLTANLSPGNTAYNSPVAMRLTGNLQLAALQRTLDEIVRRHEALRTVFRFKGGELVQLVLPELTVPLPILNLAGHPESQRESEAREMMNEHGRVSFDLSAGPLFMCKLARISPDNHILAITTHQIISDGWSNGILVNEIASIYDAFSQGRPCPLPEPELHYADFAVWHKQWLASEAAENARKFWVQALDSDLPALNLPIDHRRRPGKVFAGAVESILLPEELVEKLKKCARLQGTTAYVAQMAAFQMLMFCWTSQERFVVTTSCAGRSQAGLDGTFGRFAHPQLILATLDKNPSFRDLTAQIQAWCSDGWNYQDLPLEKVLEACATAREEFVAPELRAYFVYQKAFMHIRRMQAITVTPLLSVVGGASVDIGFGVVERLEGTRVHVEYNSELFERDTIRRMLLQFRVVLEAALDKPSLRVTEAPALLTGVGEQVPRVSPEPGREGRGPQRVHQIFEQHVFDTPDAVSLVNDKVSWTYAQLNHRANQIAWHLLGLGAQPGDRIAILMERSADLIASMLGIWKADAAFVPTDPSLPADRIALMLRDCSARFLLTTRTLQPLSRINESNVTARFVFLDELADESSASPDSRSSNPKPKTDLASLAYVLFTSGSTGTPKGVEICHRGLVNMLEAVRQEPGISPADVMSAISMVTFDASVLEIFLPLIAGARVALAGFLEARDPEKLASFLERHGATVMFATPVTWSMLIESGWSGNPGLKMLCGGEVLTRRLADRLLARGRELWNLYGPTEASVLCSAIRVAPGNGNPPIGRPIPNVRFYLLDEALKPLPPGAPGELYIAGEALGRGYINRSDLTAKSFLETEGALQGETRVYRTGDLARQIDGSYEYLGRVDRQVKIRGFRVELDEIRAVIEEHGGVQWAEVMVRSPSTHDAQLVAYVLPERGAKVQITLKAELDQMLRRRLPDYMLPSVIVFLEKLPMTSSGKVDRNALPLQKVVAVEPETHADAARDPVEAKLIEIWERGLGVSQIGRESNFFDLGGYSLQVVHLFAQINKVFQRSLPVTTIFSAPTIHQLATLIRGGPIDSAIVPIRPEGSKDPLFIVHSYLTYDSFRHVLETDRPIYGLQERENDYKRAMSTEERIAEYVKEVRALHPDGPYNLIGWCAAGPLTVELARALRSLGAEVPLLGLIDSSRPGYASELRQRRTQTGIIKRIRYKIHFHRKRKSQVEGERIFSYLRKISWNYGLSLKYRFQFRHGKRIARLCEILGVTAPDFVTALSQVKIDQIDTYDGRITLFRATETPFKADPEWGWDHVARRGVDVVWVPGDHESMFKDPHVQVFGQLVDEALLKALRAQSPQHPERQGVKPPPGVRSDRLPGAPDACDTIPPAREEEGGVKVPAKVSSSMCL